MKRSHFRQVFAKACCEVAIIALGTWVSIMFAEVLDVPHWVLLGAFGVALLAAFIVWPKTSHENDNGTSGVEKKDESQEGAWRSLWQDFWFDMLPYWVRDFMGSFLLIFGAFLMYFLFTAFGSVFEKLIAWVEAL